MDKQTELLNLFKKLKSISDTGLLYAANGYDRERYSEIREISYELLHELTGHEIFLLKNLYPPAADYPTAKVDIRALIIRDGKVLMVKESADNKWSLPGGWADIGYSPREVVTKECKEETGLDVYPERLVAVFDKRFHPHPPQPFYVYKMVFYCREVSGDIQKGFDVLEAGFFHPHELPELSADRILKSQIELSYQLALDPGADTYFD